MERRQLKRQIAGDVLINEYVDDGCCGARLDRPALDQLRADLKPSLLDTIYFLNSDRIARDATYQTASAVSARDAKNAERLLPAPYYRSLLQTGEQVGTCACDRRISRVAAWQRCPATLLDEGPLLPRTDLL